MTRQKNLLLRRRPMLLSRKTYAYMISEKRAFEGTLIDLGLHAKGLSEYMVAIGIEGWDNLAQWFHIADGIKDLSYDGILYDDSFAMCRPAYEYEFDRQELYERLVKEITLFSYLYSGLEGIISDFRLDRCPKQNGKINSATHYLKRHFPAWHLPLKGYDKAVSLCEKMYQLAFQEPYKLAAELGDCVRLQGLGLKLLYKVRNKLMHGDFFFPEPLEYSDRFPFQPEIINLCSRLALLSVQMLFLAGRSGDYVKSMEIYNSSILGRNSDGEWLTNEKNYLLTLHLATPNFHSEQLAFDFG